MQRIKATSAEDAPRRFVIIDPSLRDFVGHHHAYDQAVAAAATRAGFAPLVLGHVSLTAAAGAAMAARPSFRRDIWASHPWAPSWAGRVGRALDALACNRDHLIDLRRALAGTPLPQGSLIFAHMVAARQLLGLARFAAAPPAPLVLLLRYQASHYANPIGALGFRLLERAIATGAPVRMATDSDRLAEDLAELTALPFEVFPIPHTLPEAVAAPAPPTEPGRRRCVSLGNARDEKGFLEILEAIGHLRATDRITGLEFVLQANDAASDVQAAIGRFAAAAVPAVTLLSEALSPADYRGLLESADLVLAPYWRSVYAARTSGVALEAMAAGKPLIVTADTWMSDELERHGAGLLCPDRDPPALAAAILRAAAEYPALAAAAEARRRACLAVHNPDALVAQAIASPPRRAPPARPPRRLAVFYPWDDLHARTSGASRRTGAMLDVLAPHCGPIRVLQRGDAATRTDGKVRLAAHPMPRRTARRLGFLAATRPLSLLGGQPGEENHLWFHVAADHDAALRRRVRAMVRQADAVLLEYTYWAGPVLAACAAEGVPCVITCHDILADRVTGSALLHRLTQRRELVALRQATAIVCVSVADQAALAAHGLAATVVPNPVDLARLAAPLPAPPRALLRERCRLELPDGPFCLFVGSRFAPNLAAVATIRAMAKRLSLPMVLAGACAPPGQDGTVRSLGVIEDVALLALYRLRPIVLVPLAAGSGTSVKTIEAMAAGCAVVGSEIGFRGLGVTPGVDAVIATDTADLAIAVGELAADPAWRDRLGAAAARLAQAFDKQRVFQPYLRVLGFPEPPPFSRSTTTSAARSDCR